MRDLGVSLQPSYDGRGLSWGNLEDDVHGSVSASGHAAGEKLPSQAEVLADLPTPHQLYDQLSDYVVGQEAAKKALSRVMELKRESYTDWKNGDLTRLRKRSWWILHPLTGSMPA